MANGTGMSHRKRPVSLKELRSTVFEPGRETVNVITLDVPSASVMELGEAEHVTVVVVGWQPIVMLLL